MKFTMRITQTNNGGSAPATPGFNAVAPEWLFQGAAGAAPAIPAAESTLGSHPCVALSSAQVLPEWINRNSAVHGFSANGANPLNFVSHSRGSRHGFTSTSTISRGSESVTAGLKHGPLFGATIASNDYRRLGGEASYVYRQSDLKLSGAGRDAGLGAHTQFADFRMVWHFAEKEAHVRPFVAGGGGVGVYTGTGVESAAQPLNSFAGLTATRQTKPMLSAAAGFKVRISKHVGVRFEVRDFITPFPDQVIAPLPGTSGGGWLHNILPMVSVVGVF